MIGAGTLLCALLASQAQAQTETYQSFQHRWEIAQYQTTKDQQREVFTALANDVRQAVKVAPDDLKLVITSYSIHYTKLYDIFVTRFRDAMDDDFNTPEAYSVLFDLAREVNRLKGEGSSDASGLAARLRELGGVLGILQQDPEAFFKGGAGEDDEVAET